jgi:hypothetical protein
MLRALTVCCVFVLVMPAAAAAEWHLTPFIGATFFGKTSLVDIEHGTGKVHREIGGSAALMGGGVLGVEGLVVWTPGFFQTDDVDLVAKSRSVALMGNVMLTTPRRWTEYTLRPFVSGGFGLIKASSSDVAGVFPVRENIAAFNIGGGAIGFLTQRTGLRFDLRYYSGLSRSDEGPIAFGRVHLRYMTASVGVVLRR